MSYPYDEHILRIVVGKTSYVVSSGFQPARELSEELDAGVHSSNRLELDLSGKGLVVPLPSRQEAEEDLCQWGSKYG